MATVNAGRRVRVKHPPCACGVCTRCKISATVVASYRNGTRRMAGRAWTPEQVAVVRDLLGKRTIREIAAILAARFYIQRSHRAIENQAYRMGLGTSPQTLSERDLSRIFSGRRPNLRHRLAAFGLLPLSETPDPRWGYRYSVESVEAFMLAYPWAYDRRKVGGRRWQVVAAAAHRRDPWLTLPEAAKAIGLVPNTLLKWIAAGLVETKRQVLGCEGQPNHRISARQLDHLLEIKAAKQRDQEAGFARAIAWAKGGRRKRVAA